MLAEWFKHLTTPCPAPLKRMGYLKELIAMDARHRRCHDAWATHLRHCHDLIGKATENISHRKAVVLGSGLLLDIPIEELAAAFEEVALVDIVHLPAVEKRVRAWSNVRLQTLDLTGVAEATWRHVNQGRTGALPAPESDTGPFAGADLVVSANLLTQLPLLPMGLVQDRGRGYEDGDVKAFAKRIVSHHLDFLMALPGRVCLLTETERVIIGGPGDDKGDDEGDNGGGDVVETIDPLFGNVLPAAAVQKHWTWDIAPRPEINRHIDLRFRMTGIADLKGAEGQSMIRPD